MLMSDLATAYNRPLEQTARQAAAWPERKKLECSDSRRRAAAQRRRYTGRISPAEPAGIALMQIKTATSGEPCREETMWTHASPTRQFPIVPLQCFGAPGLLGRYVLRSGPRTRFPFVMRRVWPAWGAQKPVVLRELSIAPLRLVVEPRLSRSPPSCVRNPRSYVIVNKLGMDARRAPANLSHRPDESTNLGVNAGPPRLAPLGDLRPVSSESIPIPPRDCVRVDDHQAAGPHWPRAARSDPDCPVQVLEQWAGARLLQRRQLLSQNEVLQHQVGSAPTHARMTPAPREMRKMSTRSVAAEFRLSSAQNSSEA